MDKVLGKRTKMTSLLIDIQVRIIMIKNRDMESFSGLLAMFTKEIIKTMKEKDMGRCILQMALYTKVTGREVYNVGELV